MRPTVPARQRGSNSPRNWRSCTVDGIRANCVAPGHIVTPMVAAHLEGERRRIRSAIAPLRIEGDAWAIAQAAFFLAGPASRFLTGVTLPDVGGVPPGGPLSAYGPLVGA